MAGNELITKLTACIVAAYLKHNQVPADQMTEMIKLVHNALADLSKPVIATEPRPMPAVPIRRSVMDTHITCLECGYRGQMLKRHIMSTHGFTPEVYRSRWGLPLDYPMLAHGYSEKRSELAKRIGLGVRGRAGRRRNRSVEKPEEPEAVEPTQPGPSRARENPASAPDRARRGRPRRVQRDTAEVA